MDFISHSPSQIKKILADIGKDSLDGLFSELPDAVKLKKDIAVPQGCTEMEVRQKFSVLFAKNKAHVGNIVSFLGAGAYDHFIPDVIDSIISRGEFLTAYTPYQAEMSQGLLQSIWEFQELIASVTGTEVSNASLYDAGTALAEAAKMAFNIQGKNVFLVPGNINPQYLEILKTYNISGRMNFKPVNIKEGVVDVSDLKAKLDDKVAAVIVQQPNYFGCVEDLKQVADLTHAAGALLVSLWYPIASGLLKTPGACGADIVVGDGQPLGIPLSFGGPYLGFIGTRKKYIHNLAGRIVGKTVDTEGKESYVLTLQAREQHIKRERASSNICSNQALAALRAAIYLSLMGSQGLKDVATLSYNRAHQLFDALISSGAASPLFKSPFFNEFAVTLGSDAQRDKLLDELEKQDIFPGVKLEGHVGGLLMAVTEKNSVDQIERVVRLLKKAGA